MAGRETDVDQVRTERQGRDVDYWGDPRDSPLGPSSVDRWLQELQVTSPHTGETRTQHSDPVGLMPGFAMLCREHGIRKEKLYSGNPSSETSSQVSALHHFLSKWGTSPGPRTN